MQQDARVEALVAYQRPIKGALGEARRLMALNEASSIKALALIRWELMRHLRAYQFYKHTHLFNPLIAGSCEADATTAADLKGRCIALASAFEAHVRRWSLTGPMSAWSNYVEEALQMAVRIESHLAREAEQVGALLTRDRTAPPPFHTTGGARLHSGPITR